MFLKTALVPVVIVPTLVRILLGKAHDTSGFSPMLGFRAQSVEPYWLGLVPPLLLTGRVYLAEVLGLSVPHFLLQ